MAWPLIALAAAGAIKGLAKKKGEANAAKAAHSAAEDERMRKQSAFMLSDLPQLQGAEQRKTMGNLFARGMWGNFGRNPATGAARSPEMAAIMADPWRYRTAETLAALSPHARALAKPKGPGVLGYLGAGVGGAAEGAGAYYSMGGNFGMGGGGAGKIAKIPLGRTGGSLSQMPSF